MQVFPEFDAFRRVYDLGEAQILSTRLVADLETPVSAMLKLARNARYSFLLESVEGGAVRGRYSIIGMRPDVIWKVEGRKASINRRALFNPDGPFETVGIPTSVPLLVAFALVCAAEVVAAVLLWRGRRAGTVLALVLLPVEFAFWIGFALPFGPLLAVVRTAAVALAARRRAAA